MSELIPVTLAGIVLAWVSHLFSKYDHLHDRYFRKDRVVYLVMSVILVLYVGLRTGYNDTGIYTRIYEAISPDTPLMEDIHWLAVGENPGFHFTNRVLVRLGFSTQSFLMFYAVITLSIYLWFIRKYSCNIWLSIFLMFTMGVYTFTLAAIKQCVAVAFALVATDRAIRRQYVSFVLWILLAALFHPYALMYLLVPLLMFEPWSGKSVALLAVFGLMGLFLESLIGTVVNITDFLGEGYDTDTFTGEGVNPIRVAVVAVPALIALIARRLIKQADDPVNNLMVNLAMLNAEIMFVGLFGTAIYFGRLANYFLILQTIALPWLFTHFERRSRRLLTSGAVACYALYYIYTNAIHESFDHHFYSTTLVEYLESLF